MMDIGDSERRFFEAANFTPEMEEEYHEAERSGALPEEIDRFGDRFLKFLLTTPERKPILLDLTNATLRAVKHEPLTDIKPMDRELTPNVNYGRGLRLDYHGTTTSGRVLNLEFQKYEDDDFVKRALFCTSALIQRQLLKGDLFDKLRQTIFIGLLKFDLFTWDGWCWDFVLSNIEKKKVLTEDLLLIFVEMEKLGGVLSVLREKMERGDADNTDALTRLALWGGYMTGMGVDILAELMKQDEIFTQVLKAEQDFWDDRRNRFLQWIEQKREMDARWPLYNAERRGEARGRAEGEAKGRAEGKAEGRAEGEAKARAESKAEKDEIVRGMLEEKMPLELIRKISGYSEDEIASLGNTTKLK